MTDRFDDDLERRLAGLSADLDGVSLDGPSAARRRGTRRSRHQVTGGVLAGVAAVAAGVLVLSPSELTTTPEPAPPASLSTMAPGPTTTALELSAALLTPEDVAGDSGTWATGDQPGPEVACDPAGNLDTMSSLQEHAETALTAGTTTIRQDLVRLGPGSEATGLRDDLLSCLPERGAAEGPATTDTLSFVGVGDEGWIVRYYADPADQQADAVTIAIVRSRDVVSVTVRVEPAADTAGGELDTATPEAAAARMCDVLFGDACVSDDAHTEELTVTDSTDGSSGPAAPPAAPTEEAPTGDPTTPAEELLQLADDPFLTEEDVAEIGSATGFVRQPEMDVDLAVAPCLQDPMDYGAITVPAHGYNHELDASLFEWVGLMPDAASAIRMVTAHTTLTDCGDPGEDREQTVGEPVAVDVEGADDAVVWTVESTPTADNPGSSSSFAGIGVARVGNIVVAVAFGSMDDPSGGDWPGVATGLLASAMERAVG
ncbi:hypothetical protein [Jiangella endophytica]|uniref:hypothetical protein n=1 Tax=Jiangella endophytica TaxID=1623398 RepID=UPI000E350D00|nr:hypothetical protein [Jiangella endophytica]